MMIFSTLKNLLTVKLKKFVLFNSNYLRLLKNNLHSFHSQHSVYSLKNNTSDSDRYFLVKPPSSISETIQVIKLNIFMTRRQGLVRCPRASHP